MGERLRGVGFLLLHAAALVYTGFTLRAAWPWLSVVRLIADHIASGIGLPAWLGAVAVPLALLPFALVAVLGVRAAACVATRLRRSEPEPAAGLRLRMAVYAFVACLLFNVFVLSSADSASGPFRVKVPIL